MAYGFSNKMTANCLHFQVESSFILGSLDVLGFFLDDNWKKEHDIGTFN